MSQATEADIETFRKMGEYYALIKNGSDKLLLGKTNNGHFELALSFFDAAIRIIPTGDEAHYGRAIALSHLFKTIAALDAYRTSLELNPNNASAWQEMSEILWQQGRDRESLEALGNAVKVNIQNKRGKLENTIDNSDHIVPGGSEQGDAAAYDVPSGELGLNQEF